MIFHSANDAETEKCGAELSKTLCSGDFVAMYGDLGAGKTAFVRGLACALGNVRPSSPTFTIVNQYNTTPIIYHFDIYRISSEDELYEMGYEDYLEGDSIIIMEWAELCPNALPNKRINVTISKMGDESRSIIIEKQG